MFCKIFVERKSPSRSIMARNVYRPEALGFLSRRQTPATMRTVPGLVIIIYLSKASLVSPLPGHVHVQCSSYTLLDSSFRNYLNRRKTDCNNYVCCDKVGRSNQAPDWKGSGWYRIGGQAGTKIIEKGTGEYESCGVHHGGWLFGGHPTPEEGEVNRTVYFDPGNGNSKDYPISIKVTNCNRKYFVFYLPDITSCRRGYCTE